MKKLILKEMDIKNFRGTTYRRVEFGNTTTISGSNGIGKTQVADAYCWLITGRVSNGNVEDVRPYNDQESDVYVKAVFDYNGEELVLEKFQSVEFEKKSGKVKGNKNRYFVNNVMKKAEKDYREFLNEIASEEELLYGTIATSFLNLDTKKARAKLFDMVSDFTDEDVLATNLEFEKIRSDLKNGTPEELISSYRYQVNGRGRSDKGIKGKIEEIPARIDEQQKFLSTKDFDKERAELESKKDVKTSEILMLKTQLAELSDKQAKVMELKFKANDIEYEVTKELRKEKDSIAKDIISTQEQVTSQKYKIRDEEARIKRMEESIVTLDSRIAIKKSVWQEEMAKEFVANDTCPTCGQKIPKAKIDSAKSAFDEDKKARCNMIASSVNEYTKKRKECASELEISRQNVAKLLEEFKVLEDKLKELRTKDAGISEHKKIDNVEHKAVLDEIEKLNKEIESIDAVSIRNMVFDAQNEVSRIDKSIARLYFEKQNHDEAVDRIEQLQRDRKYLSQEMALIEQKIDILKDFQKAKCNLLTEKINSMFDVIEWKLFKQNLTNDSYTEICKPTIHNIEYAFLNHANKMLAELDICRSFQRIAGIEMPIFIDDAESLDSTTTAGIDKNHQMVFLKVADSDFTVEAK